MSEQGIRKTERHITVLPREIDRDLAIVLGEMVVAFGRLEDMFKVAIKRIENRERLDEVIKEFSGGGGTLGQLISYCHNNVPALIDSCDIGIQLNQKRQDFIHATFAATEDTGYVRFRKLVAYTDLELDKARIREITQNANSLIEKLDQETGSLLTSSNQTNQTIATVSASTSRI